MRLKVQDANVIETIKSSLEIIFHQEIRTSNDLHGTETFTEFDRKRWFTKPIQPNSNLDLISDEPKNAQADIKAKRKLRLIIPSKSVSDIYQFMSGVLHDRTFDAGTKREQSGSLCALFCPWTLQWEH